MKKNVFIATLVLAFAGCQSDDSTNPVITDPVTIEFAQVAKHELYGAGEEEIEGGIQVINSAEEWEGLLQQMSTVNGLPENFGGDIDFSQYTVIAAFSDIQTTGGHFIDVVSVVQTNTALVVSVENSMDGEGNATMIITQPYHIVKIPKTTLPAILQ